MEARQAADITENGHQTPEKLIETVKDSSTKMQSVRCGIANKDYQGYFCGTANKDHQGYFCGTANKDHQGYLCGTANKDHRGYLCGTANKDHQGYFCGTANKDHQGYFCGIANKDHQGCFCGFNAVPVLLGKQASEKDKGAFQKTGDAFQYSRLLQTLESHRDIMCQLHHLLATSLTKREGYDAKQG